MKVLAVVFLSLAVASATYVGDEEPVGSGESVVVAADKKPEGYYFKYAPQDPKSKDEELKYVKPKFYYAAPPAAAGAFPYYSYASSPVPVPVPVSGYNFGYGYGYGYQQPVPYVAVKSAYAAPGPVEAVKKDYNVVPVASVEYKQQQPQQVADDYKPVQEFKYQVKEFKPVQEYKYEAVKPVAAAGYSYAGDYYGKPQYYAAVPAPVPALAPAFYSYKSFAPATSSPYSYYYGAGFPTAYSYVPAASYYGYTN